MEDFTCEMLYRVFAFLYLRYLKVPYQHTLKFQQATCGGVK